MGGQLTTVYVLHRSCTLAASVNFLTEAFRVLVSLHQANVEDIISGPKQYGMGREVNRVRYRVDHVDTYPTPSKYAHHFLHRPIEVTIYHGSVPTQHLVDDAGVIVSPWKLGPPLPTPQGIPHAVRSRSFSPGPPSAPSACLRFCRQPPSGRPQQEEHPPPLLDETPRLR